MHSSQPGLASFERLAVYRPKRATPIIEPAPLAPDAIGRWATPVPSANTEDTP